MFAFKRSPSWSAATAAERIRRRIDHVSARRAEIEAERTRLDEERAALSIFADELERLLMVEKALLQRRALPTGDGDPEEVLRTEVAAAPTVSLTLKGDLKPASAVSHSGKRAYSREGKCFIPAIRSSGGSTRPRRYAVPEGGCDPGVLRLIRMMEVPGLIHAMVMAEKAQQRIDVDAVHVPEAALGINLADAYRDHVFSLEAYKALIDPAQAGAFLSLLEKGFPPTESP